MNTAEPSDAREPLSYTDSLPLSWKPLKQPLTDPERESMCASGVQLLTAVVAVEEHRSVADEETPLDGELVRVHQKLDLLLELVSGLMRVHAAVPPAAALRLSSCDAIWHGMPDVPAPGSEGILEIYLHRCVAQPLRIAARVSAEAAGSVRLVFTALDQACSAALERHVFLHHRRSIAEARLSKGR